jgi:membrane protein required for colicin V production
MNWLDIVIVILLLVSAISGFANGLIKSIFSLVGLIVGIFLAGHFYVALSEHLTFISNENAARIVAFIIIFLAVAIVAGILGAILTKIISAILLGWLNRLGGAVFGVVLGGIFIGLILAIWVKYAGGSGVVSGSAIAPILLDRIPVILALLPKEFDTIRQYLQ